MLKTHNIQRGRMATIGRSFWLWFIAAVLVVVSMAISPSVAFADEYADIPAGVLTLIEDGQEELDASVPEGETESAIASNQDSAIPEASNSDGAPIVSNEIASNVSDQSSANELAQVETTESSSSNVLDKAKPASTETVEKADSENNEAAQAPTPVETGKDVASAGDDVSDSNDLSSSDIQADEPSNGASVQVPSESAETVLDASTQQSSSTDALTDIAANAPPAINGASNQSDSTVQGAEAGSYEEWLLQYEEDLSNWDPSMTVNATTLTVYFYDSYSANSVSATKTYGPNNDYIYDSSGNYLCVSGDPYSVTFTGSEMPATAAQAYKRYGGYQMDGMYINYTARGTTVVKKFVWTQLNTQLTTLLGSSTINSLHASYTTLATSQISYTDLQNSDGVVKPNNPNFYFYSTTDVPDATQTAAMTGYDAATFAGWYYYKDVGWDDSKKQYYVNSSSMALNGTETAWDVIKHVFNITPASTYDASYWEHFKQNPSKFQIVPALKSGVAQISYQVTYTNTNAGGLATSETQQVTHGTDASAGQTQVAIAKPTGFTTPTLAGYDFTFAGWATTAGATTATIKAGDSLANAWGSGTPVDQGTYTLYAVWTKTPQKYTVIYNSNGWSGKNAVTENNHEIANAGTETIKNLTQVGWGDRTGYQFEGWSTSASGAATINAGATLSAALSPVKGGSYSLYAVWTKLEYTINFNYNGGTRTDGVTTTAYTNKPGATNLTSDISPTPGPTKSNLTKTGYIFGGWSEGGNKVANADGTIVSGSTLASAAAGSTHNLTAIWNEITYTINWYAKWTNNTPEAGASATSSGYTYTAATTTSLSGLASALSSTLTADYEATESGAKVKYTFKDWYVTKGGTTWKASSAGTAIGGLTLAQALEASGATVSVNEAAATGTITIYGVWEKQGSRTITYFDEYGPSTGAGGSDTVYTGDDFWITKIPVNANGYSFTGWKSSKDGTVYTLADLRKSTSDATNTLYNVTANLNLTAQWTPNTVKFKLDAGTTDSTVVLNGKANPTAKVGDSVAGSDLTTATPTRNGYDFAGWSKTSGGTAIIGGPSSLTYTVVATDAPADNTEITLYATWTAWTYTVRYWKNQGTDSANAITVYKQVAPGDYSSLGSLVSSDPYVWTAKTSSTDNGLAHPDIILKRDWYNDPSSVKWGITATATAADAINDSQTIAQIYALTGRTDRIIDLYAIWESLKYTIKYEAKNSNGTVTPTTETIDLAVGKDSDVIGSTASVTVTGYTLAVPTWTDNAGNVVSGCSTTAKQATYKPTISYLRSLYKAVPSSMTCTFYANFTEAEYAYKVQAYMQKADGTWDATWTSSNDYEWSQIGTSALNAKLNTTVDHTQVVTGTSVTAMNGKTLADLALITASTSGITNQNLYVLDTTQGVLSITISSTPADNVLKLYYKRMTYELVAEFKVKDESGTVTAGKPDSVTTQAKDHVNGGNPTTSLRWGQTVAVTNPTAPGYSFAWSLTNPTGTTLTNPLSSFSLSAADMNKLFTAGQSQATLTGTFTVISYKITLVDGLNSPKNWDSTTAGTALKTSGTASTNVPSNKNIATWLPNSIDRVNTDTYYLAGWVDSDDPTNVIAPDTLRTMTNWTKDKTFTAKWLEKVLISYDPGSLDSYGNSKAAWVAHSTSFTQYSDPASVILSSTTGAFATLVGAVDASGNPKGADGWEFDYWTVDGDTGNYRYGQISAYVGSYAEPNGRYLDGATASNGINLAKSLKFIAHWKPAAQTVVFNNSGRVDNNSINTNTVTTVIPNTGTVYYTDDEVDLGLYTPAASDVPAGYEFGGWDYEFVAIDGSVTTGKFASGSKFHVKNGQKTTLTPYFNEKTVTFKYEIDSTSTGRGTISPVASDTVFAIMHNGINAHTATSSNTAAFDFVNWVYDSNEVTTDAEINQSKMGIQATDVLTADRTYYANFSTIQYKLLFTGTGTDGTTSMGTVQVTGTGAQVDNSFMVDWGGTIPSGGIVNVTIPEGYELDGWIIDGAGAPQSFSGGTAANNQGVYNYVVNRNVTLTAHFKMSNLRNYTVNYQYDPDGLSLYSGTQASRMVAWGESVLPASPDDNPVQSGFTFEGWFIDAARTISITDGNIQDQFGVIYTYLGANGATAPNYDAANKSITIYGKWSAEKFTVTYDLYGNVPNDTSTTFDDVIEHNPVTANINVGWNDPASGFKVSTGAGTFERPGYVLSGWTASYVNASGSLVQSSTNVLNSDTYGALAGNDASHRVVTLHAIWTSQNYTVVFHYNDRDMTGSGSASADKTYSKGWAESVDYYTLGAAPVYNGYKFDGWDVTYVITTPVAGTQTGTRLTAPGNTTIRDIVGGNTSAIGTSPIVEFTAHWTKESSYYFQDRLVRLDGTYADRDVTSVVKVPGDSVVTFSAYGTPKTSYEGYDFDNHVASNPNWSASTAPQMTITAGSAMVYYVYYLERAYKIDYYVNNTDAAATYVTSDNAWDSAAAKLPTATPTKAGYTFDGWYLTDGGNEVKLTGTNSIYSTGLFTSAPANGATLKAVGKWIEDTVTIEWAAAANGNTNPAPGSVTRGATEATAVNKITAVPTAGGDYVFDKWTYEYTDPTDLLNPIKTGDVTALSPFATLSGTDGEELTPIMWAMHTGEGVVWHDIKFTAHFALSSALSVTIEYYYENGDKIGQPDSVRYELKNTETKRDAVDGAVYVVTPTIPAGFALNSSLSKLTDTYNFSDPSTQLFKVYLDALDHQVEYRYVDADGVTIQTAPTGADPLTNFNNGTFKTGQTHNVSNAPTLAGWTFKGWYLSDNYGGTDISGTTFKLADQDVLIVGTWERAMHTVNFINDSSSAAAAAGCTVSQTSGGYQVQDSSAVKTAVTPDAGSLGDLGVTYNNAGKPYTLTGWDVLIGGVKVGSTIGISDPLTYVVTSDVTFQAVWSPTYAVSYTRGSHGAFMDSTNTDPFVKYVDLQDGVAMPAYNGTVDGSGNPVAVDGWQWVGWGVKNGSTWTYYFADDADIDYGTKNGTNVTTGLPATVTSNIEFVAFYKALERTLIFSVYEYDSTVPAGTESSKTFADNPQPTIASGIATSYAVKTGQNATMLGAADVIRAGYTLSGWTDGTKTYTPGSTTEFVMPDGQPSQVVYLYPVFGFTKIEINYAVASDSTGWGSVSNNKDTQNNPGDPINGSSPIALPGYVFDYWTKDAGTTALTAAEGLQADGKLVPSVSGTYYAHFKVKIYDLEYVKNADPVGQQETLPTTALPTNAVWTDTVTVEAPTRPGFTFTGWDVYEKSDWTANGVAGTKLHTGVAAGNTTVSALSDSAGTATSLVLVPTWSAKTYKVIFNDGKATGTGTVTGMPATNPRTCDFDSNDIDGNAPTRDGYTFMGWSNSVKTSTTVVAGTLTYSDLVNNENDTEVTLTAIWQAKAHTITYVKDATDTWSGNTSDYPAGDPIYTGALTDPTAAIDTVTDAVITMRTGTALTRSGYKLLGWNDGTADYLFSAGATYTMPDADVTLTPIWDEAGDYNVYFLPGAASGVINMPSDRTSIPYATNDIDASAPTRAGYTFDGWTNSVTGLRVTAGTGLDYATLVANDDTKKSVTLTANWILANDYKVVFDENAGGEYVTDKPTNPQDNLKWDDTVTTLNMSGAPGRPGYIFEGWTIKDINGTVLGGTDTTYFTAGSAKFSELAQNNDLPERKTLTLVAVWTAKTFSVEFAENKPAGATGTVNGMPATNPIVGLHYDSTGIVVPTLTLDGYTFGGWTNSATSGTVNAGTYDYATLAGSDSVLKVTLTAIWTAVPHTLTYTIGGGDSWSTTASNYPVTDPVVTSSANPADPINTKTDAIIDLRTALTASRPGSTLVGWKDNFDNTEYRFALAQITLKMPNRDVTLVPIWSEDTDYEVHFFAGDSVGATKVVMSTMPGDQVGITYNATGISTAAPTRPGYLFAGWSNDAGTDLAATVASASYAQLVDNDHTKKIVNLTAKWTADTNYKVTYKDGVPATSTTPFTGTLPADISNLGFDDAVPQTELNTTGLDRIGYTFDGWKVTNDADGSVLATVTSGYSVDAIYSALVAGNADIRAITFTAMWSGTPYKVTYHLTDGNWVNANITDAGQATPNAPLTYSCEQTVALRLENTVKRDGYTLAGWATSENKTDPNYIEYRFPTDTSFAMPARDVDLYPLWTANTYSVYFVEKPVSDTGSIPVSAPTMPTPNPQTGEYNDTIVFGAPTRTGYDFAGWDVYKTSEYDVDPTTAVVLAHVGAGTGSYASLAMSADIDALTMVATWTPQKLGVTYILDSGDRATWVKENITDAGKNTPTALISYEVDETVNLRESNTVSRAGFVLIGWKDSNSGSTPANEYLFDASGHASFVMPAQNVVLYAIWQIKDSYTVVFNGNAPTTDVAPGAVLQNVPDDQPIAPAKLTWEGSTSFVDTHSPTFDGYTFLGWDVYGTDNVKINTTPILGPGYYFNTLALTDTPEHEHLTLVAQWEIARIYNVYFKDGVDAGDTPVNTGSMPSDATGITYVTVVDYHAPTRVGYTFDGWDVVDITNIADPQTMGSIAAGSDPYYTLAGNNAARKSLELTARWIEKTGYNVRFVDKPEGDTGATPVNMGGLADYIGINWDDQVVAYPAPTRTGYDFVHWAVTDTTDPDNVTNIGKATAGSYTYSQLAKNRADDTILDITLTAIWKVHEWTVQYVNTSDKGVGTWVKANITDAGKNTPDDPVKYSVDDTVVLRNDTTLVMTGYKLVGWQDDEVAPTNVYLFESVTEFLMPDNDVKLYPIWAAKVYTVLFDGNKPVEATDPSQVVTNLPVTQWETGDPQYPLKWADNVDTHHPTLAGYSFKGWVVENASTTGARTGLLTGTTYEFKELALTDIAEHETLKLIAQWEPAVYRVTYVDPVDATGAAVTTPVTIATDATKLWIDVVSDDDPWTISTPAYTGKSSDDWQFMGWTVYDVNTNTYVDLSTIADHKYGTLAAYENLTLADSATEGDAPALILYANWLRRVPFVVDFVKRDGDGTEAIESSTTLVGLDGQVIETTLVAELSNTTWKDYILNTVGPGHGIPGYAYDAVISEPYVYGTLVANATDMVHVKLIYKQLADYTIIYDGNGGALIADPTKTTDSKSGLIWDESAANFAPDGADWFKVGYVFDGWTYGPTGTEYDFNTGLTFSGIAQAIYVTVDGTEGRDVNGDGVIAKPVTLYAKWKERETYKVKYDTNYKLEDAVYLSGITDQTHIDNLNAWLAADVANVTVTPADKLDVKWSDTNLAPSQAEIALIKKPGIWAEDGVNLIEKYALVGWNYLSKDGTQKAADGMSFAQIVADMYDPLQEPENGEIMLYARYKALAILHYDKNAEDATGVIPDVEEPYGTLITLSDGSGFQRPNWTIVGWNTKADGTGTTYELSMSGWEMPQGETTLYAMWAKNKATLTYLPNGEDVSGLPEPVTEEWGTDIPVSDGVPTRPHYKFKGWNTKADGTGEWIEAGTLITLPADGYELYAQWEKNKYTVTVNPGPYDGGHVIWGNPGDKGGSTVEHGDHVPEGYTGFVVAGGYHITGWRYTMTDEFGNVTTGIVNDPSELEIIGDVVFEPVYEADYDSSASLYGADGEMLAQTGDKRMMIFGIVLGCLAILALIFMIVARRRRRNEEEGN